MYLPLEGKYCGKCGPRHGMNLKLSKHGARNSTSQLRPDAVSYEPCLAILTFAGKNSRRDYFAGPVTY